MASRGGIFGIVAGVAALAVGGVAVGMELEKRVVSKRLRRDEEPDREPFFALRSEGPDVITPDGVTLHTEIDDLADADLTLVFVHGYALSLDCWHFQRKHYRGAERQVFYDQRSHGRSGHSEPDFCRVPQLAQDLRQVLEELAGPGPLVLIGHSMGGMTIMNLAADYPELFEERVRGVALLSTSAGELADHSPIRGIPGRTFGRLAEPLMATLNRIPEVVEKSRSAGTDLGYVVTKRFAFGSDVPMSYVEFVSEMLGGTTLQVVADFYPTFADLDETEGLAVLTWIPTAVVGGEADSLTPVAHTEKIIDMLPAADALILPDCGHLGLIEHHEAFNEVLDRLVARVRAGLEVVA